MKKSIQNFKTFGNNIYALKTIWRISKKRVIHTIIGEITGYGEWLFFSIFFMRYLINAIETEASFESIIIFVGICAVIFGSISLYKSYSNTVITAITDVKIYRVLYQKLFAKARNVELRCFEDAEFYNSYTMALDNAAEKMTKSFTAFAGAVFGIIASGVAFSAMFMIDPYSILFIIFPISGNFVFGGMLSKIDAARYKDSVKNNRKMDYVNRVMYLAEYAKEIRYSGIHGLLSGRFRQAVKDNRKVVDKYAKKGILVILFKNTFTFTAAFEGIMIYAAYRAIVSQTIGLAELAIMFSAMVSSSWILIGLFDNVIEGMKNGKFLEYFRAFMEYQEKIPENGGGIIPDEKVRSIEFRGVSFEYKPGEPIIRNLSFTINGDSIVALVGHNGAGKTTIMKLLFRLYDPSEGEILVNGVNIKEYNLKAYRRLFAAAFQDYKVMSMPVRDNILMGAEHKNADEVVERALKSAGIFDRVMSLPNGINTILTKEFDKDGVVFSGGEIQKIIAARAFAQKASVKVFDEPSSALDPIAEFELYNSIMQQSKGQITLFISHRLSSVKDADMVYMLENGTIIEQGTHAQLMKNEGAYSEMFTMQAQNYLAVERYREGAAV
jgi:ATP-binding cassette subfamily B protein